MLAMVDKGGGRRDVLKSYNPPPSYASVLSGRRGQSFFGGSTPLLPTRNSEGSTDELGRHEKRLSESVGTRPLAARSQAGPSTTSHSPLVSTGDNISAASATYYSSSTCTTSHLEPVEKMEPSPACVQGMEHENQKFLPGHAISFEEVKTEGNECDSSKLNPEEISGLDSTNLDPSRNRKSSNQEIRNSGVRDEPNVIRIWSPPEHSQRRINVDDDDGKKGQYMGGKSVNHKYRNDARPRYENLEDKENRNNSEKRKSFLPDQDGWLTKVPIQKKAKNEKPVHQGLRGTRSGEVQRYAGQQRSIGPRPLFQQGRGRDPRREYQGGRQTLVYSNSRGSAFGGRQSNRGIPPERSFSTSAPRRNDMVNFSPSQATISVSLSSTSAITSSGSTASVAAVPPKSISFLPQPIVITSTTVCRPDLTPPPPPACGTFSYRDILAKGIQSPPTPVQASKTDQLIKFGRAKHLGNTLEMRSESSERPTFSTEQNSPDLRDSSPVLQTALETPLTSYTSPILIPTNAEEKKNADQHLDRSLTQRSFSISNEVFTSASNEKTEQGSGSDCSLIQSRCELLAGKSQSFLMPRTDPIKPDHLSSGPPPGLAKRSSVETTLILGIPPGFQNHILETSQISSFNTSNASVRQSDGSNVRFSLEDTFTVFAAPTSRSQIPAGHVISSELEVVQEESMMHQTDHGTTSEKDQPSKCSQEKESEIGDSTLNFPRDSGNAGCVSQESNLEQDFENSKGFCPSENSRFNPEGPSTNIVSQSSEISEYSMNREQEQNKATTLRLGENLHDEHPEPSRQLLTADSSSSSARTSDAPTFHLGKTNSVSTSLDDALNNCEFHIPSSLNRRRSPEKVDNPTYNSIVTCKTIKMDEKEGEEELVSETAVESESGSGIVMIEDENTERDSECQPNKPLSAGELLQQIQSNQNIFSKKGVILNKVQENLSYPRNKKTTERAPAPPPTPNDDSYSGGWGSTPVEDTDPEGSPFHLITSAAKELEHSISCNPTKTDVSNICPIDLGGNKDQSEFLNTVFAKTNVIDDSKREGVTIQSCNEKDMASDSCSDFNKDPKTVNDEEDFTLDNSHSSRQDTTYNIVVYHDLNNNKIDECGLHLCGNVQNLQQSIGKDLKTSQASVPPIVIKPMRKLEAYFPNASQTWTSVSQAESNNKNTEALPRRVPKTKLRSNDPHALSSVEASEDALGTEVDVEQIRKNVSSDLEIKYQTGEPTTVQELEQSPASSKREWLKDEHSSMSPDIYGSMNAGVITSENLHVSSTSLAENNAGFASEIQSSMPSNTNDIWNTNQSKPNLTLPKSNPLTMERPETSPLETLLKHSSATSINLSTNYFKDTNTKVSTTVQTPIPLTTAQLLTTTVTTPKEQRSVCPSSDLNYNAVFKVADATTQPGLMGSISSAGQQTVSSNSHEFYHLMQQGSNVLSGRSPNIPSGIPSLVQTPSLNPYRHPSLLTLSSQLTIQAQEMDYQQMSRMSSGQHGSLSQQPHLNYVQPPAAPMQYPNMFDPRWSNNYSLDMNQSEWLNINRFPSEREFARPPQLHPLSQPVNIFNYPPPSMPPPKESIFPNFNYPPPTFQPGYRLQTLPGFLQRPPPPLPPQYNSGYYNRTMDTRNSPSLRPPLRESPNRRDQSFGSMHNRLDGDRMRPSGHLQNQYQDMGNKPSPNESYTSQSSGGANMNSEQCDRYDPNHGNKLQRPGASRQPHDPVLADYIPRNLDAYNKNQVVQETSFNSSWKHRNLYNDKRAYGSGRKNFKPDQKEEVPYPPLPSSETYLESENQMGGSRRKSTFKGNLPAPEPVKCSKPLIQETKQNTPMDYHKHEKPPQMQYSNPNDMFLAGQAYPSLMPPLEFGQNPISFGYPDNVNDPATDKVGNSGADYTGAGDKPECDDSQLSHASSPFDVQDFCSGGWKYYHETITSPSGLRIHQSTYVPYPTPCGSMTTAYLSTNDVRARIQWLGFKKAHELYTSKINAQRSLRMDVTVVCSKGGAVCCNSDILGTCSAYFHDRLFGRTDEYITIFVNVPSKIMKHFLQMMSCGEVFVPINDVNEVIMKAPIYLNLNM